MKKSIALLSTFSLFGLTGCYNPVEIKTVITKQGEKACEQNGGLQATREYYRGGSDNYFFPFICNDGVVHTYICKNTDDPECKRTKTEYP